MADALNDDGDVERVGDARRHRVSEAAADGQRRGVGVAEAGVLDDDSDARRLRRAAAKRNIERVGRKSWENLRQSLARADNLEEGHYAERAWAGLLSPPLPPAAEEALRGAAANVCREPAAARLLS